MNIQRWKLTSPDFPNLDPVFIVASDKATAWRKFITQRFGDLKPNRADWRIDLHFSAVECTTCRVLAEWRAEAAKGGNDASR